MEKFGIQAEKKKKNKPLSLKDFTINQVKSIDEKIDTNYSVLLNQIQKLQKNIDIQTELIKNNEKN